MTRGIVLIAMGHENYGEYALNLAVSIRFSDKDTPIHLLWAGSAIRGLVEQQRNMFTSMSEIPKDVYFKEGKNHFVRAKFSLYELSPFDMTMYLDVDTIFFKRPASKLFDELAKVDFAMINEGHYTPKSEVVNDKYTFWADPKEIHIAYMDEEGFSTGRLYMLRSEFIYFKKSEANRKFFELALDIFDNPRVVVSKWANSVPDEFAFNIAGCILHHYPHQEKYCPIFWEYMHKDQRKWSDDVYSKFYAYSVGGNVTDEGQRNLYNNHVKHYWKQLRLRPSFLLTQHTDKKCYLPEREKI